MNKELTSLKSNLEEISRIKQAIKKAILELPDNPNIKRISEHPRCFVMNSSEMFKANKFGNIDMTIKRNSWSVFYHDFKSQYEKIAEIVEKSNPENIMTTLNFIINNGHLVGKDYVTFHPSVIANLKTIL